MAVKGLKNMIRLHEWTVDERRRELAQFLRDLERLDQMEVELEAELKREQSLAAADPDRLGRTFGAYYDVHRKRREQLAEARTTVEEQLLAARENLSLAYMDLKKYEIAQDIRDQREKLERDRQEQEALDEMGLTLHRRAQAARARS